MLSAVRSPVAGGRSIAGGRSRPKRHDSVVTPVLVGSALLRPLHSPSCLFLRNRGDWRSLDPMDLFPVFGGAAERWGFPFSQPLLFVLRLLEPYPVWPGATLSPPPTAVLAVG